MSQELTADDWVAEMNRSIWGCVNLSQLWDLTPDMIGMRKFDGIFPHCVHEARKQLLGVGGSGGVTTVVDGEGILFQVGFACKRIEDVASSVISILRNVWKATLPRYFIVAFDDDRRIKRELFPEYKADREPDAKKLEIESIKNDVIDEIINNEVQVEIAPGYEADDIICSVASQCQVLGQECVIVASDKDVWQCLGPETTIYNRNKQSFLGTPWLKMEHRITPSQVVDWLVLVGKNGIPGAYGIGPKIASDLLEAYGTFHDILSSTALTPIKRAAIEGLDYWRLREIHSLERTIHVYRGHNA